MGLTLMLPAFNKNKTRIDETNSNHHIVDMCPGRNSYGAARHPQFPERVNERRAEVHPAADRQPQDRVYLQRTGGLHDYHQCQQ